MTLSNSQISYVYARNLFRALGRAGISGVCLSPGFRNSPLVLAAHQELPEKTFTHIDERGAAFFALGLAKASGKPAVVACTSGTAAANYFPAILEAFYANIPLLVITADRPYEMIGIGANQSMKQTDLYGTHVRLHIAIPPPTDVPECLRHLQFSAERLYAAALSPNPGPVHLNLSFREPFLATAEEIAKIPESYFQVEDNKFLPPDIGLRYFPAELANAIRKAKRPCIAIGPGAFTPEEKKAAFLLAKKTKMPIFAEASSGLGCAKGAMESQELLLRFDHYLRATGFGGDLAPDLILRFGPPLTSKFFQRLIEKERIPQVIFDVAGEAKNPSLTPALFCPGSLESAFAMLESQVEEFPGDELWTRALRELERQTEEELSEHIEGDFTEWAWMRQSPRFFDKGSRIFLGNSMPIRDWDSVSPRGEEEHRVLSNRGLSGIDGLLSTAIGVAAAEDNPIHLMVGDLSILHDLNALTLAKNLRDKIRLTIWVHNNGGGEIFRIVPTGRAGAPLDWFTTPQQVDFSSFAKGFQLSYLRAASLSDFDGLGAADFSGKGVRLVELLFQSPRNTTIRQDFWGKFRG